MAGILGGYLTSGGGGGLLGGQVQPPADLGGGGGFLRNNSDLLMALGSSLLGARGMFGQGLANFGQVVPAATKADRTRMALNNWLKAKSAGMDPATLDVLRSNPELTGTLFQAQMTPHQHSFIALPTGGVASGDQITGEVSQGLAPQTGGDGFNAANAVPYEDKANNETGLIDKYTMVKRVISRGTPTADQAGAAAAMTAAQSANEVLRQTDADEAGLGHSLIRGMAGTPGVAPVGRLMESSGSKQNEQARAQFQAAIRGMAIAKGLNPESAEFSGQALFAQQGDDAKTIQQKANYRDQIVQSLGVRAGPFAQGQPQGQPPQAGGGVPPPPPGFVIQQ